MKRCFLIVALFPFLSFAQTNHDIGVGTYLNYSILTNLDDASGLLETTPRFNVSPFVEYNLHVNRFRAGIGAGLWQSSTTLTANVIFFSIETQSYFNYVFVPVTLGYDFVKGSNLEVGVEGKLIAKYLYKARVSLSGFGVEQTYTGSELTDSLDASRFILSPGGGLYLGYKLGRIVPTLQAGLLYDLKGIAESQSDQNKFLNPYVAIAVRYRLFDDGDGSTTR